MTKRPSEEIEDPSEDAPANDEIDASQPPTKKIKQFSPQEFRKKLHTDEKTTALQQFLNLIKKSAQSEDIIFEYFQAGGNCLELFQIWEFDAACPAPLILEIAQHLIVEVIAKYPDLHLSTLEACRYLLNTHLTLINKMLQLASTPKERFVMLKLLATMVSFSSTLVKDILLHVKFQVNLLTKHMDKLSQSVRLAFVQFILSFFIDGHYPTILQLLNKKYLFSSIMPGLRYDPVDTVNLVLMTLKTQIIDKEHIPKPVLLKIFTNTVVKGLVHLYNWRGPHCIEEKRQRPIDGDVNMEHQQEIAGLTHEILVVLCTSIKHGIIFRDETFGTGAQHRNPLMFNIIEMSFAAEELTDLQQELIVKMAVECPDLVKTIWEKLLPSLEPRPTAKWIRAIEFLRQIINGIQPTRWVFAAKTLKPLQFAQVIQFLVTPTLILQQIVSPNFKFNAFVVKQEVIVTIHAVLRAVRGFLTKTKEILSENYYRTLRKLVEDHLQRNMPSARLLLRHWMKLPKINAENRHLPQYQRLVYMTEVINVLKLYYELCPELYNVEFQIFDDYNELLAQEDEKAVGNFMISAIQLMILVNPAEFKVNESMEILLKNLHEVKPETWDALRKLLMLTGFFVDCEYEVEIWINALRHQIFTEFFLSILPQVTSLTEISIETQESKAEKVEVILKTLSSEKYISSSVKPLIPVKFSPVLATALEQKMSKKLKKHFGTVILQIFHLQTDYTPFQELIKAFPTNLPESVTEYITKWPLEDDISSLNAFETDSDDILPILETSTSLFRLVNIEIPTETCNNLLEIVKKHSPQMLDMIYCHPKIHDKFQLKNIGKSNSNANCVHFLTEITDYLQNLNDEIDISNHIRLYQRKMYQHILKMAAKGSKSCKTQTRSNIDKFLRVLKVFGLDFEQSVHVLDSFVVENDSAYFLDEEKKPNIFYYVLLSVIHNLVEQNQEIELEEVKLREYANIRKIFLILSELNKENADSSELAAALRRYLTIFGSQIKRENVLEYFESAVKREYCKENALLAMMIFKETQQDSAIFDTFVQNLSLICQKKGMILPLLDIAQLNEDLSKQIFDLLTTTLEKTLQKPSKAGTHFENHYKGFCNLIETHASQKIVANFLEKPHKADVTDVFLPAIWKAMIVRYFKTFASNNPEKQANNALLCFVHYFVNMVKMFQKKHGENGVDLEVNKLQEVSDLLIQVVKHLPIVSLEITGKHEAFKTFCKICLKHGIKKTFFMNQLVAILERMQLGSEDTTELMDMFFSHSEFMSVALDEPSEAKLALFNFVYVMCQANPGIMERKHVPLLLSAYSATMHPADRRILSLLKLYEGKGEQTTFYDFKPFLWGISAGNFYSVRPDSRKSLWRQPRTGDVLDILQISMIETTIINFPLNTPLKDDVLDTGLHESSKVYDIGFLLSVFSQLLSSENTLITHKFTRSGALSIVIIALASENQEIRMAACYILARFFYHLETSRSGKDNPLWLRLIEVVAKAVGAVDTHKLNSLAALFMARTALVIANPTDPMYEPLSNFICVTSSPNLSRIPELYTFLHSDAVDFETHRHFILRILFDGLRTDADGAIVEKSMAFKLIMELFSCGICDAASKLLVLEILERAATLANTARTLCHKRGLEMWLYHVVKGHTDSVILQKVEDICRNLMRHKDLDVSLLGIGIEAEKNSLKVDT